MSGPPEGGGPPRKKPLGQLLVGAGVLTPQQLEFALKEQKRTGLAAARVMRSARCLAICGS